MHAEAQGGVELRKPDQKDDCPVFGIHLKVEEDLQVVQDSVADIIRLVNDDDRCAALFQDKTRDLILYGLEVVRFTEGWLGTQFAGKVTVKIIYSKRGQAGIDDFVQGRIEGGLPPALPAAPVRRPKPLFFAR